jgi:serine/threonine protein phosphatase PrpC
MITAEPDIRVVDLQTDDRFLILACDGVWDCLSNQQAVSLASSCIVLIHHDHVRGFLPV